MILNTEGSSYWGNRMRRKWNELVKFIHIDGDDLTLGDGVVGSHGVFIDAGGFIVNSLHVTMPNLPPTDPVNAGQLWNDNGTLKVSAG